MFEFNIDAHEMKTIHFIGIGGVSMSGIANLLLEKGYHITGSDRERNHFVRRLEEKGAQIAIGQKAENIQNPDLIVFTDAILPENEELIAAKSTGKSCVTRGVMLGALMKNYPKSIAVSGTHGKSTTTSMIAEILLNADTDPTILLGGDLDEIGGNFQIGQSDYFLTEACEYKGNILYYYPQIAIVLNADLDHVDYFQSQEKFTEYFQRYMDNLSEDALAILNADDAQTVQLIPHVKGRVLTFGIENPDADYNATDLHVNAHKGFSFTVRQKNGEAHTVELTVLGRHNVYDATAAFIATLESGVSVEEIQAGLTRYKHLHRRQEVLGDKNGATVMTDYGHHPLEIKTTLEAMKYRDEKRLIVVFQPHTYSRTKRLMDDFAESFDDADLTIVTDIYAARENHDPTVHSLQLVEKMQERGVPVKYIGTFEEAKDWLLGEMREGDLVLTTGCGNPDVLARMLVLDDDEAAYRAH